MKRVVIGIVSVVVLAAFAAPVLAQDTARGAKVFAEQKCSLCHSIAGKGNAKGSLDNVGGTLSADEIRQWILDPVGITKNWRVPWKSQMTAKCSALQKEVVEALVAYLAKEKN